MRGAKSSVHTWVVPYVRCNFRFFSMLKWNWRFELDFGQNISVDTLATYSASMSATDISSIFYGVTGQKNDDGNYKWRKLQMTEITRLFLARIANFKNVNVRPIRTLNPLGFSILACRKFSYFRSGAWNGFYKHFLSCTNRREICGLCSLLQHQFYLRIVISYFRTSGKPGKLKHTW